VPWLPGGWGEQLAGLARLGEQVQLPHCAHSPKQLIHVQLDVGGGERAVKDTQPLVF
jgi:hypothetical protein